MHRNMQGLDAKKQVVLVRELFRYGLIIFHDSLIPTLDQSLPSAACSCSRLFAVIRQWFSTLQFPLQYPTASNRLAGVVQFVYGPWWHADQSASMPAIYSRWIRTDITTSGLWEDVDVGWIWSLACSFAEVWSGNHVALQTGKSAWFSTHWRPWFDMPALGQTYIAAMPARSKAEQVDIAPWVPGEKLGSVSVVGACSRDVWLPYKLCSSENARLQSEKRLEHHKSIRSISSGQCCDSTLDIAAMYHTWAWIKIEYCSPKTGESRYTWYSQLSLKDV